MDLTASLFLLAFVVVIIGAMGYAAYRTNAEARPPGAPRKGNRLARRVVWVGYGLAVVLLVTDPAFLLVFLSSEVTPPGCYPVIGGLLWGLLWGEGAYLSEEVCLALAVNRLGWALVLSVVATGSLVYLVRKDIHADR
ncbi:hypothetical protein ACFVWN_11645 [Nocardiopsis flavescens]|uniref:hypothetical protein n=1 Tax=Nocardiopsis flavescens TaxID=758803 RepID=UPI003667FCE5